MGYSGNGGAERTIAPADVLTAKELELLAKARAGRLTCPWCKRVLLGEFLYLPIPDVDDFYAGVWLSCKCGFVEY